MRWTGLPVVLKTIAAIALSLTLTRFDFHYLESFFYDARFRLSPVAETSGLVELVTIDRKTLAELNRPLSFNDLSYALLNLRSENPRAVVFTLDPRKVEGEASDKLFFSRVMNASPENYVAVNAAPLKGEESSILLPPPLQGVRVFPAPRSADTDNFAADGVSRRLIIHYQGNSFLPAHLAESVNGVTNPMDYRGAFDFRTSIQTLNNIRPKGTYPQSSFWDVLHNRFPKGNFTGKIVLVGIATEKEVEDYVKTPFNRDILGMSVTELYANMIDTLIMNDGVVRPPAWLNVLITCLISLLITLIIFRLRPGKGLAAIGILMAAFLIVSWILFAAARVSITVAHPLLAIFVSYYFFIPYRLIQESRKSWEYQQKNKLLTEVEQLKTNFLSMMSHDLKTPLARIQGMADVALTHEETLSQEQKSALKSIGQSAQELGHFISSILDLGRVESQEVKLHLQSRDINSLLEEVIAQYLPIAKARNIEIIKEFETLFSTKIDVPLMKQVFSNLIENAIKYSPDGGKILISTEESGGRIQVQVADQGVGIPTDEVDKVFMKFYRTNNVKNGPIKGSGLGLYLAKYFIELHKGDIQVESVPEQGSTFTVELPIQ